MTLDKPPDTSVTTVDLAKLEAKDPSEVSKLLQAAEYPGFFYLDCRNAWEKSADLIKLVYKISDTYFDQSTEIKMQDFRKGQPASSDRGYKFCETDESFEMSTHEMHHNTLNLPVSMKEWAEPLNKFHSQCHEAGLVILEQLAESIGLPLQERHRVDQPSESGLKLIAEPLLARVADVAENKHRDSGTITLVFYDQWGLQVCLSSDEDEKQQQWVMVPPPPEGCAVVHGANSLERLSGARFRSPLHRVTQLWDGSGKRYFLSHFVRPEDKLQAEWAAAVDAAA